MDVQGRINSYVGELNRNCEPQSKYLSLWEMWYNGYDPDFHKYAIYQNGIEHVFYKKRMNFAKKSVRRFSKLTSKRKM